MHSKFAIRKQNVRKDTTTPNEPMKEQMTHDPKPIPVGNALRTLMVGKVEQESKP